MILKFFGVNLVKNERKYRQNQKKPFFRIWTSQVFVSINTTESTNIKNISTSKKLSIENSLDEMQSRDMEEKNESQKILRHLAFSIFFELKALRIGMIKHNQIEVVVFFKTCKNQDTIARINFSRKELTLKSFDYNILIVDFSHGFLF